MENSVDIYRQNYNLGTNVAVSYIMILSMRKILIPYIKKKRIQIIPKKRYTTRFLWMHVKLIMM